MASVASALAGMAGSGSNSPGALDDPVNAGNKASPGSGAKSVGVQRPPQTPKIQLPQMRRPATIGGKTSPLTTQPPPAQRPQFSAANPMTMVQPPPVPHPGLMPPYPDARSPQPTMMPNGQMVLPPPAGFIGAGMPPRVPKTFIPGMTGLLGR